MAKGEQPEDALRRELREEIGLEVANLSVSLVQTVIEAQQVEVVFRCTPTGEPKPQSVEIEACEWLAIKEAAERLGRGGNDFLEKALSE